MLKLEEVKYASDDADMKLQDAIVGTWRRQDPNVQRALSPLPR